MVYNYRFLHSGVMFSRSFRIVARSASSYYNKSNSKYFGGGNRNLLIKVGGVVGLVVSAYAAFPIVYAGKYFKI